ncbi:calpain family cysteine protease containing protein [Stylonychia lemnae]|uniref:Calpain family cysteine protease containing protein n=1 Tax=Stylonychia lemnae TaxID=5949 RepID=A0A078A0N5_STYLE|nr:calpain family cysteine protease containing protein [Stylonychia lemnae]|eukprot:CDW74328.1 calpain family cysteine protease containing protein [Stylonychia lemnae]
MISITTLTLLIGSSLQSNKNFLQKTLAELNSGQNGKFSCTTAIDRWKAGPDQYQSIFNSAKTEWVDTQFPADSTSIQWVKQFSADTLNNYKNAKWVKLGQAFPTGSLFGSQNYLSDVDMGILNDGYVLGGAIAVAKDEERFKKVFVNTQKNLAGAYGFNIWVRGIPTIQVINDNVPYDNLKNDLIFADIGSDGSYWVPLLEKAWAKTLGNYEQVGLDGNASDIISYLTNVPITTYNTANYQASSIFEIIDSANDQNYIITAQTLKSKICPLNLICGQTYAIINTVALDQKQNFAKDINLIQLKSIQKTDGKFQGKWNDDSALWTKSTETYTKQAKLDKKDDGVFWIEDQEFITAFGFVQVGAYRPSWKFSWYSQIGDLGNVGYYFFSLDSPQNLDIKIDFYNPNMYPISCRDSPLQFKATVTLRSSGAAKVLHQSITKNYFDIQSVVSFPTSPLPAGKYKVDIQVDW